MVIIQGPTTPTPCQLLAGGWEAQSVEAVKNYLEPKIGKTARNTDYGVDNKVGMGLAAGMI